MKKKFFIPIVILIIFIIYIFIYKSIGNFSGYNNSFVNKIIRNISPETKTFLMETFFFTKNQKYLKKKLAEKDSLLASYSKQKAKQDSLISEIPTLTGFIYFEKINEIEKFKVENKNYLLKKFKTDFLPYGKNIYATGSSYLDYSDGKLFIASATGIFGYVNSNELEKQKFQMITITTNIKELIKYDSFFRASKFGLKDLLIYNNKIYVSYSNQVKKNCYNTSILVADLNLQELKFEEFFTPSICVDENNTYGEFEAYQSGGKMVPYKNNQILFTLGEYRFRDHAQDKNNLLGKIISIDIKTKNYEIISIGHRNPQGLYYENNENIILSTDHGPRGGDEININMSLGEEIENYGWPISSYGEHYKFDKRDDSDPKYIKAPLHKSHKDYGFIEPVKYFTAGIGISEIIKLPIEFNNINKKQYFVASMGQDIKEGDKSIHHFQFNDNYTIFKSAIIPVNERIRDMIYVKELNKVFLFLENSSSIGVLEIQN